MSCSGKKMRAPKRHYCGFCDNHGKREIKNRHDCDFFNCDCEKCELTREAQNAMRQQQRIWRYLKPRLEALHEVKAGRNFEGQLCDKCRNHNELVPKKKHVCPHEHCKCSRCVLTSGRREIMKYHQRIRRCNSSKQSSATTSAEKPAQDRSNADSQHATQCDPIIPQIIEFHEPFELNSFLMDEKATPSFQGRATSAEKSEDQNHDYHYKKSLLEINGEARLKGVSTQSFQSTYDEERMLPDLIHWSDVAPTTPAEDDKSPVTKLGSPPPLIPLYEFDEESPSFKEDEEITVIEHLYKRTILTNPFDLNSVNDEREMASLPFQHWQEFLQKQQQEEVQRVFQLNVHHPPLQGKVIEQQNSMQTSSDQHLQRPFAQQQIPDVFLKRELSLPKEAHGRQQVQQIRPLPIQPSHNFVKYYGNSDRLQEALVSTAPLKGSDSMHKSQVDGIDSYSITAPLPALHAITTSTSSSSSRQGVIVKHVSR